MHPLRFSPAKLVLAGLVGLATVAQGKLVKEVVDYSDGSGQELQGFAVYDDSIKGPRPGVIVVHDWKGLSDSTQKRADMLARLGYVAFAADVYGKGVKLSGAPEWGAEAGKYKGDRAFFRARERAAYEAIRKLPQVDPSRIAAIGYCFGGTGVIEMARDGLPLKGVVCFHGDLDRQPLSPGAKIQAKVLALCGADDPFQRPDNLAAFDQQMREEGVDYQIVQYGHAVHAFTDKDVDALNLKGAKYNAAADHRSWQAMENFLAEIFAT